jgi:DNA-directed RNA polymerase alpha subunit
MNDAHTHDYEENGACWGCLNIGRHQAIEEVKKVVRDSEPFVDLTKDLGERKRAHGHLEKYKSALLQRLEEIDK